ncbi:MAG: hypothetical protein US54_C0008G0006 [Candidatus Roizmanbacteria bacterium GW2011_GWA2_37_7]|uniref:Lipolytic protein G-D-S-L family n=1 Tax=Candidatus Roizmanbacteria bacterium GW2011_GWA2_37_7 TaxID=1618481 RepID=A0A0G0KD64_9BACT|nr:MAG: hypothetical protein US54_C0008G0006 [Candidatus Roizmanbacteria bacterium GW2011_GWA2_37_7]
MFNKLKWIDKNRVFIVFTLILIVQLYAVYYLVKNIYYKNKNVKGLVVMNTISKEDITYKPLKNLLYYYELNSNIEEVISPWAKYKAKYTINSDTLNERYEYKENKDNKVYRIITLGDSYTFGLYVNTENNWTEILEDMLNNSIVEKNICEKYNKVEIINLGVYGYDIQYSVERFNQRGKKYNPDLIIWLLKHDDTRQIADLINKAVVDKSDYYQELIKNKYETNLTDVQKGALIWDIAHEEIQNTLGVQKIFTIQNEILKNFNKTYKGKIVVVTFPNTPNEDKNFLKEYVKNRPNSNYFETIDIFSDKKLYFLNDYHPTKEGHEAIADDIYSYIISNNIISCN